jgi:hypothetical protein
MNDSNYNLCMDRLRKYKAQALKQAASEFPDHPAPDKAACIAAVEILKEIMTAAWGDIPQYALHAMRAFMQEHQ